MGGGGVNSYDRSQFRDVTHPGQRAAGHREFVHRITGLRVRYDPARGNHTAHWHVFNPQMTGNHDMYLNRFGQPSPRHHPGSALTERELEIVIQLFWR